MAQSIRSRAERAVAAVVDFVAPVLIAAWLAMLSVGVLAPNQTIAYEQVNRRG